MKGGKNKTQGPLTSEEEEIKTLNLLSERRAASISLPDSL